MKPLPKLEVAPTPFSDGSSRVKDVGASVVLPLHQRLSLIRAAHKCSKAEARRILWQGDANSADPSAKPDPWADAGVKSLDLPDGPATGEAPAASGEDGASPGEDGDASAEDEAMQACVVNVTKGRDGSVLMCCPGTGLREFAFDAVLGETSSQADVYDAAPRRLVADFLNGRNACIFAYGQTGSGKTHTMFGPDLASGCAVGALSDAGSGIVPRSCSEVMAALEWRRARGGVAADLQVSYVEIYGEQVTDLLRDGAPVGLWHGVAHRAVYTGDCAQGVGSAAELRALLLRGDEAKRRAATAMNERSSRAHALLLLSLRQLHAPSGVEVWSSLCLADLGGSEKVLKSEVASMTQQAGGYHEADVRLREAVNINLGLLALKSCIKALNDGGGAYVPYQNSRLTMMLSAALGGDCRTAVVVTGSGERRHAVETMHALRFGEDCAKVATTAGADSLAAARRAIRALDSEIEEVRSFLPPPPPAPRPAESGGSAPGPRSATNPRRGRWRRRSGPRSGGRRGGARAWTSGTRPARRLRGRRWCRCRCSSGLRPSATISRCCSQGARSWGGARGAGGAGRCRARQCCTGTRRSCLGVHGARARYARCARTARIISRALGITVLTF